MGHIPYLSLDYNMYLKTNHSRRNRGGGLKMTGVGRGGKNVTHDILTPPNTTHNSFQGLVFFHLNIEFIINTLNSHGIRMGCEMSRPVHIYSILDKVLHIFNIGRKKRNGGGGGGNMART